ncbi:hypothetical protein VPH35_129173 [Triticum aestivum]
MMAVDLSPLVRAEVCILPRSAGMEDLERRLQLAVVVYVGGARPPISCVDAAIAISEQLNIPRHRFSVHKFHPEDFLIIFASHELRNRALGVPLVEHQGVKLYIKPWLRQAQAKSRLMRIQVDLMIEGVPSHAWSKETATELLGNSCLIESLVPETASREDLSLFKLRAWCVDPEEIPTCRRLWVPEPQERVVNPAMQRPSFRQLLEYPTLIHIGRLRDHTPPELWRRSPSSDGGSGQSGLPDSFIGSLPGGDWTVLQWTRGVCDNRGVGRRSPGPAGGIPPHCDQPYRQALVGRIGPSNWRIPPIGNGGLAVTDVTRVAHRNEALTGLARSNPNQTVERPLANEVVLAGALATPVLTDKTSEEIRIPDKVANEQISIQAEVANVVVQASLPPIVMQREPVARADDAVGEASPVATVVGTLVGPPTSDPMRATPPACMHKENTVGTPEAHRPTRIDGPVVTVGRAPMQELLAPTPDSEAALVDPALDKAGEVTTLHAGTLDAATLHGDVEMQQSLPSEQAIEETRLSSKEQVALGNIKTFCASLLKKLAPSLLKEIEMANGVRPGQDPFTPRRNTRSLSSNASRSSKASAAETVLLKALGIVPDELAISEGALVQLREMFDSPLQDKHLRAIAVIFGKSLPMDLGMENLAVTAS